MSIAHVVLLRYFLVCFSVVYVVIVIVIVIDCLFLAKTKMKQTNTFERDSALEKHEECVHKLLVFNGRVVRNVAQELIHSKRNITAHIINRKQQQPPVSKMTTYENF